MNALRTLLAPRVSNRRTPVSGVMPGEGIGPNLAALAVWLHCVIVAMLLLPPSAVPPPDETEIELVQGNPDSTTTAQDTPEQATPTAATAPESAPIPTPPEPVAESFETVRRPVYAATANPIVRDQTASVSSVSTDAQTPQAHGYRNPAPQYPAEAERRRLEGVVGILIRVNRDGSPDAVEVTSSSGAPMLDKAAVDALQQWRFAPVRDGDRAVSVAYPFNIRFVLGERR